MQITVPSGGHFLITSKGEHIPLGARVDVTVNTLRYVNAILGSIEVGIEPPPSVFADGCRTSWDKRVKLEKIYLWADDFTKRDYDESEEYEWGEWDHYGETIDLEENYDVVEITLHTTESDIGTLYELATHGLSKDEFIEKFKELAAEYGEIK